MGTPSPFWASITPAMVVVATAPIPGSKTASLPSGDLMVSGLFTAGLQGK